MDYTRMYTTKPSDAFLDYIDVAPCFLHVMHIYCNRAYKYPAGYILVNTNIYLRQHLMHSLYQRFIYYPSSDTPYMGGGEGETGYIHPGTVRPQEV